MAKPGRKPTPIEQRMKDEDVRKPKGICLSDNELAELERQAAENNMNRSEYIRALIKEKGEQCTAR